MVRHGGAGEDAARDHPAAACRGDCGAEDRGDEGEARVRRRRAGGLYARSVRGADQVRAREVGEGRTRGQYRGAVAGDLGLAKDDGWQLYSAMVRTTLEVGRSLTVGTF